MTSGPIPPFNIGGDDHEPARRKKQIKIIDPEFSVLLKRFTIQHRQIVADVGGEICFDRDTIQRYAQII